MKIRAGALPHPKFSGDATLEQTLNTRRSERSFSELPIDEKLLSQLLWSAQGVTSPAGLRTAPSAGAIYPLRLYPATAHGLFRYDPDNHAMNLIDTSDLRPRLSKAALDQSFIEQAPLTVVFCAVPGIMAAKYGEHRSPRYIYLETGHAAQNLMLQAAALGLGSVPVGAFHDGEVAMILGLTEEEIPVYLVTVGFPA